MRLQSIRPYLEQLFDDMADWDAVLAILEPASPATTADVQCSCMSNDSPATPPPSAAVEKPKKGKGGSARHRVAQSAPKPSSEAQSATTEVSGGGTATRSGRVTRRPKRPDEE